MSLLSGDCVRATRYMVVNCREDQFSKWNKQEKAFIDCVRIFEDSRRKKKKNEVFTQFCMVYSNNSFTKLLWRL